MPEHRRSLLSVLFKEKELIRVLISKTEVQVLRNGGEMQEGLARDLVVLGVMYHAGTGRFQLRPDATIRRCGISVSVKEV